MVAAEAADSAHELALEKVRHNRIVSLPIILGPLFRLIAHRVLLKLHLLVLWLHCNSIELVMHPIKQEAQKLLSILLPEAAELADCA